MKDFSSTHQATSTTLKEGELLFRGVVRRITYRNSDTGFGVMKALAEDEQSDSSDATTIVGLLPPTLGIGMNFIARGSWQTHAKFGKQFKARSLTETLPTQRGAIEKYLSSGVVKGFGPVLAKRVVEKFGDETMSIIEQHPRRLLEVPGIGERKLDEILTAWNEKRALREVLLFFQNYGISGGVAHRIFQTYGQRAVEVVKSNPYLLARDVWGIGFQTADQIGSALGIDPLAPERVRAGVLYTLKRAGDDGHCYLPLDALMSKTGSLIDVGDEELLRQAVHDLASTQEVVIDADCVYAPNSFQAEDQLSRMLALRLTTNKVPDKSIPEAIVLQATQAPIVISGVDANNVIRDVRMYLSAEQKEAIQLAAAHSLLVITGGPGCGKTTVLRTIAKLFRQAGLETKLAAPTGRAAQRLGEVCEMKASTIHRLLKFDPIRRSFLHDQHDTLPLDALIVDESSMLDIQLAASLFKAIPPGARLVIVGDADQLPSVGPGLVLGDMLAINNIQRVRLTQLFRRADESRITTIAHEINSAVIPRIPEPDGSTKSDAYFLPTATTEETAAMVERLVTEQIPKRFGFRGSDIMVLSPMNQGEIGIVTLNQRLQAKLVPPRSALPSLQVGNIHFRLGDRVIQRVNNYNITDLGVFNGDQGDIVGIDADNRILFVRLWDGREVEYTSDALDQLDLAYAITVHRAQGSEVPAVVLVLHDSHSILLERQLLYTAVTRAKKLLIIVGTPKALASATKRTRSKRRYSGLTSRTQKLL